jgi:hypothetical protein
MFKRGEILAEFREATSKKNIYRKPRGKIILERKYSKKNQPRRYIDD